MGRNHTHVIPGARFPPLRVAPILTAMSDKPAKRRVSGGRVTPKGTRPEGYTSDTFSHTGLDDQRDPSPMWVPVLMFSLLGGGIAVILLNYVGSIWDTSNAILLLGLGMILGGIITATQYR